METFSLLDDQMQASLRTDLSLHEIYKTRLVKVDLESRSRTDPFQRRFRAYLWSWRYWRLSRRGQNDRENLGTMTSRSDGISYQNNVLIAEVIGRSLMVVMTAVFLIVPLAILPYQSKKGSASGYLRLPDSVFISRVSFA